MDFFVIGTLIFSVFLIPTAYAGVIGAPWAPTRMASVKKAFDDIEIGEKDTVVDLGAGNGAILAEAAQRGAHAIGYELSPIMWIVARVRILGEKTARIVYGNFFRVSLPENTTLVFFFLMPKHMDQVGKYLAKQPIGEKTLVLSYAFPFKGVQTLTVYREKKCAPLYLYDMSTIRFHFDTVST
ncbi:MAG: class I SAM-dependent methyltransferase [Patescibacteria group bacterium]